MNAVVVPLHRTAAPVTPAPAPAMDRILRLPAVRDRVGLSTSTIYRRMAAGQFPSARSLGGSSVGWRESDINAWIAGGAA